jgi:hypothetical protein
MGGGGHEQNYGRLFDESGHNSDKSLEDAFFAYEVKLNQLSFDRQMQYGVFYSYIKLKEQEIRYARTYPPLLVVVDLSDHLLCSSRPGTSCGSPSAFRSSSSPRSTTTSPSSRIN